MNEDEDVLARIRQVLPDLAIDSVEVNQEGLVNDVVIVNNEIVFRFPKTEWGQQSLAREVALLDIVREHVSVPLPRQLLHDSGMSSYRLIAGTPLSRESLFWMAPGNRETVLNQLGTFLSELHTIPQGELAHIGESDAERTRADWLAFHEQVQDVLFPLLFRHQRQSVRDLFAPIVSGKLDMETEPVLIHGDLAPYHILVEPDGPKIAGIIDFGTAGLGDPATDIATLLVHYGGRIVDQMARTYPIPPDVSERARFRAACLELEWALIGIRQNDPGMLVAHIAGARDYPPLGPFPA